MSALAERKVAKRQVGSPLPRVAPPTPARTDLARFIETAKAIGIELYPWQQTAARYLTALGPGTGWQYPEVAIIVARQNGKTEMLVPLIVGRLLDNQRIMHTAQNAKLPREVHERVAEALLTHYPERLPSRRAISYAIGHEEIRIVGGGHYQIVAPTKGGARGPSRDLVLVDELREMESHDFIGAAKPTLLASKTPQIVYLSNAGTSGSEVLNALKSRADTDPSLAYLEWSAGPKREPDDVVGWLEANPSIGHNPATYDNLEREYRANLLGNTMAIFETEHLCRWVPAMEQRLVSEEAWLAQEFGEVERPLRSVMAINMDISGDRASAVVAWQDPDERINLDVHDTQGSPIDVSLLGPDLVKLARANRVTETAFDPYTDADLVRHLLRARAINGREYANASEKFARLVAERKLRINDPTGVLTEDLRWTTRRPSSFSSFMAVRASEEHAATAALAAVRAAWLASHPSQIVRPARIY